METAPIEDNLHIKKILDYLPVIAIFVIVFIGFFTWDVIADKMSGFITLIGIFVFVLWVYCGDPKTYLNWLSSPEGNDKFIIPPPGATGAAAAGVQGTDNSQASLIPYIGVAVCILLGLGLGFGSIGVSRITDYNPSQGLKISGGIILAFSIIGLVFSLWKIFGTDGGGEGGSFKMKGAVSFFASIAGIYMISRAQKIETEQKELASKDTQQQKEYANGLASAGATTILSFGLILQIIGVGLLLFFMLKNNNLHAPSGADTSATGIAGKIIPYIPHGISAMLFISGMVLIAKSQRWPGFDNDDTAAVTSFDNKTFAAHGGIWTILSAVFLLIAAGRLEKFKTYNFMGWIIILALFALFSWSLYDLNKNTDPSADDIIKKDRANDNSYYSQLKAEVIKDLKSKSAATDNATITDAAIDAEMKNRIEKTRDKNTQVTQIVSILFTIISIIICVFIIIFRNARLYIALCKTLPASLWAAKTRLFVPVTDSTADCATKDGASIKDDYKPKIENDTMKSTDWDEIIKTNDDDATGGGATFSTAFVRLAKGAAWVPFLSVILLILWVSILFTKVTTSEATNVWIANSFTGDMFPKVKELIDTFFIVLIVGLLLCGILLLPMVKELNIGGLDTILRFAESIQVWQYDGKNGVGDSSRNKWSLVGAILIALIIMATIAFVFIYDVVPKDENNQTKWIVSSIIFMIGLCSIPGWYFLFSDNKPNAAFNNESIVVRLFRLMLTAIYLIPFFFVTIFKLLIFAIPAIFQNKDALDKIKTEFGKFDFTSWMSRTTDLTLLGIGKIDPASVSSVPSDATSGADAAATADAPVAPATATGATGATGISETKVSAVGKLIKVVLLTISFVIMILATIYLVYKVGANNRNADQDAASGGFVAQLNSPTAQVIYVIMAIVAVAGVVAYIREKFTKTNSKTPEDYLFDDYKPEDVNSPMRQLTFGMTHIIYVVLMIIVWVYDTDKDDKNRMSVTGMTVLGLAILFFHYFFEFIDNKKPGKPGESSNTGTPGMLPMSNLLTNIRFIINTIFLIVLCVLAYYKQHSVMVVLVVVMFIFHLTKSILGMKVLRLIWLCIIYIPCLFLGLLTTSQGAVGDTTRPIWIILAIEILLAAILFGGPYLLNYIGASNSQIIAAPVPLRPKHDTGLTTQSPQIFIFHNTGLNRSDSDKAANCAPEEKKRYNYSVSGWFWLNNSVNATDHDLEIFNFGGVPKLTYNPNTTEFKVSCKTISLSTGLPDASYNIVYNSRFNYSNTKELKNTDQIKFDILNDSRTTDTQIPIQKWNYFVINYDGKSMDVFLNNVLVAKSNFFVPDIVSETITSGDNGPTTNSHGLSGNICNVAFHKEPLTLEQIRWTYSMLKSKDPPMVGMKTIADEVKTTGTTNMYSQ